MAIHSNRFTINIEEGQSAEFRGLSNLKNEVILVNRQITTEVFSIQRHMLHYFDAVCAQSFPAYH